MLTQEREAQVRQLLLVWLKSMVQVLRCECVEPDLLCASLQADAHGLLKLFAPVFEVDGSLCNGRSLATLQKRTAGFQACMCLLIRSCTGGRRGKNTGRQRNRPWPRVFAFPTTLAEPAGKTFKQPACCRSAANLDHTSNKAKPKGKLTAVGVCACATSWYGNKGRCTSGRLCKRRS